MQSGRSEIPDPKRAAHTLKTFLFPGVIVAAFIASANAQENQITPPPPLSPPLASEEAEGGVDLQFLRNQIENAAQTQICAALAEPGETISPADCRGLMLNGDRGVKWRNDGRPSRCRRDCLGPPRMGATEFRDAPNFRYAKISGHLGFDLDVPYWFDRSVRYRYDLNLRCNFEGASSGAILITPQFFAPQLNDPPIGENIVDFFLLPANLSRYVEGRIKDELTTPGAGSTEFPSDCTSIGVIANPAETFGNDMVIWDLPGAEPRSIAQTSLARPGKTATVYFDRIERKRTPEVAPPNAPAKFTTYINGADAEFPKTEGFTLTRGESQNLNYCKTVQLAGKDSLQIIVAESNGGAAWSQFSAAQAFGGGAERKITTGRDAWEPVRRPGDKPRKFSAREYEITYHIEVHDPNAASRTTTMSTTGGASAGATSEAGASTAAVAAKRSVITRAVTARPQATLETTCTKI